MAPEKKARFVTDHELLQQINAAKASFDPPCGKFSGAVTAEIIRQALIDSGIPVSSRDVFVRGLPIEIDLIIPSNGAAATLGLLYEPSDVLACLEIKNAGSFGEKTIAKTRADCCGVRSVLPQAQFIYVTLSERSGFSWALTEDKIGSPCFTLFNYSGSGKRFKIWPTGDWAKLLILLEALVPKGPDTDPAVRRAVPSSLARLAQRPPLAGTGAE